MNKNKNKMHSPSGMCDQLLAGLKGSDLHWSTVVEENGKAKSVRGKKCALCNKIYNGGPCIIEVHLDETLKPREVSACIPVTASAKVRQRASVAAKSAAAVSAI